MAPRIHLINDSTDAGITTVAWCETAHSWFKAKRYRAVEQDPAPDAIISQQYLDEFEHPKAELRIVQANSRVHEDADQLLAQLQSQSTNKKPVATGDIVLMKSVEGPFVPARVKHIQDVKKSKPSHACVPLDGGYQKRTVRRDQLVEMDNSSPFKLSADHVPEWPTRGEAFATQPYGQPYGLSQKKPPSRAAQKKNKKKPQALERAAKTHISSDHDESGDYSPAPARTKPKGSLSSSQKPLKTPEVGAFKTVRADATVQEFMEAEWPVCEECEGYTLLTPEEIPGKICEDCISGGSEET